MSDTQAERWRMLTPFRHACVCGHPVSARTGGEAVAAMGDHVEALRFDTRLHAPASDPKATIQRIV